MNSKESLGCVEPPEHWPRPAASEEGAERLSHQESLDLAERLPRAKVDWLVKNDIPMQILKVPEGYARLTLDGKIAYLGQNKLSNADPRARRVRYSVADPRIRYFDRRCAAVGPGNSPLGGINVDDLWIDKEGKFTLKGKRLDPESDVVQQYKMIRYENARFVRQNFPSNRFEGGSRGSKYSSNGKGDRGKGKGKAKAWSLEVLEDGLNLAQKQAIDLQMDHDLAQTPDQMIRDWLKKNQQYAKALHPPSIENMRKEYWAQNNVEGPGPGDFDDWGNRSPEVPQTAEVENPPDSDSDSDDSVVTVIHNPVGNGVSSEPEGANDDQNAKAKEEAIRDQIRKADEALRKEEDIRDQIRKADEALRKAEDKRIRESERRKAARKELEAMEEEGRAREEAVRRLRQEEGIEEEEVMEEEETMEEEAVRRGRPRRKTDGKGNGGE